MSTPAMSMSSMSASVLTLPRMLAFDGATCVIGGLVLWLAVAWLASVSTLPADLLRGAGLFLLPCGMMMFAGALHARWTATIARATVVLNVGWIAGSLLVAVVLPLNAIGLALVLAQAIGVAAITALEIRALRGWSSASLPH